MFHTHTTTRLLAVSGGSPLSRRPQRKEASVASGCGAAPVCPRRACRYPGVSILVTLLCTLRCAVSAIHLPPFSLPQIKMYTFSNPPLLVFLLVSAPRENRTRHRTKSLQVERKEKKKETNDTVQISKIFIQNIQFTCIRSLTLPSPKICSPCTRWFMYTTSQRVLENSGTQHNSC